MKIPGAADQPMISIPDDRTAFILNPYPDKKVLTIEEALNAIARLAFMLRVDYGGRKAEADQEMKCPTTE